MVNKSMFFFQDQLQHAVCAEDPDDNLPRDRPTRLHGHPLDHRQLDTQAVREVHFSFFLLKGLSH
jgi:hypothetical protein